MKRIYLYGFIFSMLLNVFTYMYFTKKENFEQGRAEKREHKCKEKQVVIDSLNNIIFDMSQYTLAGNEQAQDYVEKYFEGHSIEKVRDSILALNHLKGGNSLVGMDSPDNPFLISRMQFVNHRWIIADYDNQYLGGQVLIRYFLNPDGSFDLEAVDKGMYLPKH